MVSKSIFLILSFICLCFYLFGGFVTISSIHNDRNDCRMTFMFEHPNYVKINFDENEKFPRYQLFSYSEGHLTENARNMIFNGAPVLFIPGNSGSYKQSRSLASVALRKGIDNDWFHHLDFFAVDLNEEYAALYGGVLEEQTQFIEHCIKAILKLYNRLPHPPGKIVIVGHSIGGKIAQKLLTSPETAKFINTVITLASPMDRPVVNWDLHIESFYKSVDEYWTENRHISTPLNNSCEVRRHRPLETNEKPRILDDKLLITIGGGSKDLLVHSELTDSKYSDLHIMTSAISKVWVESDHLCIVWCLQFVLVVNRFLYSIIAPTKYKGPKSRGLSFIEDKATRLAKAEQHLIGLFPTKKDDEKMRKMENTEEADWFEDNRRIFTEKFKTGSNKTRIQMIRLIENMLYKEVRVEVLNLENEDWIFGCEAIETTGKSRYCSQARPLPKTFVTRIPSEYPDRIRLHLNLHQLRAKFPKWSHVLLRFAPTREPFQFSVDIHNPSDREIKVTMPKWYQFSSMKIIDDTLMGSTHLRLNISGLEETHQALEVSVTPKHCSKHQTLAKICVPWTDGFDRYHSFAEGESMVLWTPKSRPINYNTTSNPMIVDFLLDPSCRYSITARQSLGQTFAKIVQQFSRWLPAHIVAILCLAIKHQFSITPAMEDFKCGSFFKALATCTPFFVITVSRLFFKFILMLKILPKPETLPTSLMVSIAIHGTALAMLAVFAGATWVAITFCGSMAHKILLRLVKMPIPVIGDTCISIIEKFPASVAVLLIALAHASCGGIAIVVACFVYFILLSKMYEDYLETFVFKTAKTIAMKLFGRLRRSREPSGEVEQKDETGSSSALVEAEKPSEQDKSEENEEDKAETDEIDRMLDEAMEKQREEKAKKERELASARAEYDSVSEGTSEINFHLPIFLLLVMLAVLSVPSVVTWAKNYHYSRTLLGDPMLLPATCVLIALGFIWQLNTPRNLYYYRAIGSFLYVAAAVTILYCQDAIFRLNYIIAMIFAVIALHQILSPKKSENESPEAADFIDDLKTNYDRIKTVKGFIQK